MLLIRRRGLLAVGGLLRGLRPWVLPLLRPWALPRLRSLPLPLLCPGALPLLLWPLRWLGLVGSLRRRLPLLLRRPLLLWLLHRCWLSRRWVSWCLSRGLRPLLLREWRLVLPGCLLRLA